MECVWLQARGLAFRLVCTGAFWPVCVVDVRFSFRSHVCSRYVALFETCVSGHVRGMNEGAFLPVMRLDRLTSACPGKTLRCYFEGAVPELK